MLEVVAEYEARGRSFSVLCYLYPTAPFVTADKLKRACRLLEDSGADAVLPVVPFSYPPLRGLTIQGDRVRMKWPEHTFTRSQDLEPLYHDCGQFGFIRTETLLREKNILCRNIAPLILTELEVQDIDHETDWELAELKYRLRKDKGIL